MMSRRRQQRIKRSRYILSAILVVMVLAIFYFGFYQPIYQQINLGLDLAGGVNVELQAVETGEIEITDERMDKARDVVERRVNALGTSEATVQRKGERRLLVQIPDIEDPQQALDAIGRTALLEFVTLPPTLPDGVTIENQEDLRQVLQEHGTVVLTGEHLQEAGVSYNEFNQPLVTLQFDSTGARLFEEATRANVNRQIYITLDNEVISAPTVQAPIPGGQAQITGVGSTEEAQEIALLLNSGSLPVEMEVLRPTFVSALLGQESIDRSLRAGIIGFVVVMAFMILFYRTSGIWADFALVVYILLFLLVMVGINGVLTLPGIAGFILTIGMAVDANVIIFERVREELRRGKTLRSAIDSGFNQALRAVLDANITTLIIAGVMFFYFSAGPLRGFAVTLGLGIVLSLLTAVTVTRYLLILSVDSGWMKDNQWAFGLQKGDT